MFECLLGVRRDLTFIQILQLLTLENIFCKFFVVSRVHRSADGDDDERCVFLIYLDCIVGDINRLLFSANPLQICFVKKFSYENPPCHRVPNPKIHDKTFLFVERQNRKKEKNLQNFNFFDTLKLIFGRRIRSTCFTLMMIPAPYGWHSSLKGSCQHVQPRNGSKSLEAFKPRTAR